MNDLSFDEFLLICVGGLLMFGVLDLLDLI